MNEKDIHAGESRAEEGYAGESGGDGRNSENRAGESRTVGGRDYEGIVVLGAPRSGTTLLRRFLNAHPAIACPPETNLLSACARFLQEEPTVDGATMGVVPGLGFCGFSEQEVLERLRELAFFFMRDIAARENKPIWAEKTAFSVFHLDAVERLCAGSCRFVCVFRHGLDVACSLKELTDTMDRYAAELLPYINRNPRPLEAFIQAWSHACRGLLDLLERRPELAIRVDYEKLVEHPAVQLDRLFEFLEVPADTDAVCRAAFDNMDSGGLGDWKTYSTTKPERASLQRWRTLSDETAGRLAAIANPVLAELGYETIEMASLSEEESRRRLQLSRMVSQLKSKLPGDA